MEIKISNRKITMIVLNLLFTLLFFYCYSLVDQQDIKFVAIIGIIQYVWMFSSWYFATKNIINVYLLFLVLTFCFYLGQPVLYLFDIHVTNIMSIETSPFNALQINTTLLFLLKSIMLFHLGASFTVEHVKTKHEFQINKKAITFIGAFFFVISFIPELVDTIQNLKTTLTVGYANIFDSQFNQGTGLDGGLPRFLSQFFKSSLLLLILGNKDDKKKRSFWIWFTVVYNIILIVSGQRGSNTLFIIGLILLYHYAIKPFTKKQIRFFFLIAIVGAMALSFISTIRNIGISNYSLSQIGMIILQNNFFANILGEMGFTLIACTTVMVFCPTSIPFNLGATYFKSLFALIPNLFWDVNPAAHGGVDEVFKGFLFKSSGMGSSFIIEAYYNFGQFALFLMPLLGFLVGKLYFGIVKASKEKNYLNLYMHIYVSYIILWYVRSETITFWRDFGYYTLLPIILIKLYTAYAKKKNGIISTMYIEKRVV